MKHVASLALALVVVLGGTATLGAHAFLDRAEPRVGSTVRIAPTRLTLWFTESLEPAFSSVQVLDERGKRVDRGDSRVESSTPAVLHVSLPPLESGAYRVVWRVLSIDTHVTEGDFTFRIKLQ